MRESAWHFWLGSQRLLTYAAQARRCLPHLILVLAPVAKIKWDALFKFLIYHRFLNMHFLLLFETNIVRSFLESTIDYKREKRSQRPMSFGLGYEGQVREPRGPWWRTSHLLRPCFIPLEPTCTFSPSCVEGLTSKEWGTKAAAVQTGSYFLGLSDTESLGHVHGVISSQPFCNSSCSPQATAVTLSAERPDRRVILYKQNYPLE